MREEQSLPGESLLHLSDAQFEIVAVDTILFYFEARVVAIDILRSVVHGSILAELKR